MRQLGRKVFFLLVVMGLLAAAWGSGVCAPRIGLVLMHGKAVNLENLGDLSTALEGQGFLVATPMMPWSRDRYLNATYEAALDEIAEAIQKLKQRGATRIVVAGHSMGANVALGYADPEGPAAMFRNAPRLNAKIPVLIVVADKEPTGQENFRPSSRQSLQSTTDDNR